jgi:hypothetical protein
LGFIFTKAGLYAPRGTKYKMPQARILPTFFWYTSVHKNYLVGSESRLPLQKLFAVFSVKSFFYTDKVGGIRRGAVMNDVPAAHQNRDRPRRVARRELNPVSRSKNFLPFFR